MPYQRRGPGDVHALARPDHLVPPAGRTRCEDRHGRALRLQDFSLLRFHGGQADHLRQQPRGSDLAHETIARGHGGGGDKDQHPPAPADHERPGLPEGQHLHQIPEPLASLSFAVPHFKTGLPLLYPITDRALSGGLSHAALVERLCRGGASLIQVREKSMPDAVLLSAVLDAVRAAQSAGARLVVNDRADVAALAGARGVHLGSSDLPARLARSILGPGALVGWSTHSVEEAVAAASLPVDYVALGPVFATTHASTTRQPVGLRAVEAAAAAIELPLVAIGGIDLSRAQEVLSAGAASLAVIGDLMTAPAIAVRTAAYLELRRSR